MPFRMIGISGAFSLEERAELLGISEKALREGACYQTSFNFDENGNPILRNEPHPLGYIFFGSPYHKLGSIVQTEEEMLWYKKERSSVREGVAKLGINLWNKVPDIIQEFLSEAVFPYHPQPKYGFYQKV